MRAVKVFLKATGEVGKDNHYAENYFITQINGTDEEIKQYYRIGKRVNMGLWYDEYCHEHEDDIMEITNIEILY